MYEGKISLESEKGVNAPMCDKADEEVENGGAPRGS